ncbi:hypothetical protein HanIR_Chr03g0132571 [Helianthus annuus]|nr:hypothetical protein HanIR_Chr03g0132571 [Helianthus annuus]
MFFSGFGKTLSLDPNISIVVPEDRDGLYAIDCLDPAMPLQIMNGEKFSLWFVKISIGSWRWSVLPIFR